MALLETEMKIKITSALGQWSVPVPLTLTPCAVNYISIKLEKALTGTC